MEGRAIARPNQGERLGFLHDGVASMEGRAIARPNGVARRHEPALPVVASMEGRAIARPNPAARAFAALGQEASMEGRAIARPNPAMAGLCFEPLASASMEGRAIARPNLPEAVRVVKVYDRLQWRAGQLPGQTELAYPHRGGDPLASMEGRAIARPNLPLEEVSGDYRARASMEGRAIARPNAGERVAAPQTGAPASMEGRAIARPNRLRFLAISAPTVSLQWRAGQLPGQTCVAQCRRTPTPSGFNGGPGNCPAKPHGRPASSTVAR